MARGRGRGRDLGSSRDHSGRRLGSRSPSVPDSDTGDQDEAPTTQPLDRSHDRSHIEATQTDGPPGRIRITLGPSGG